MERLNPEKLNVEYRDDVTHKKPVAGRKYTLTHSDTTGDLFLTLGRGYAYDKINKFRDEVLGEWRNYNGGYFLYIHVYVDGLFDPAVSAKRYSIFTRELPLALEAIRYGDGMFFSAHPQLDNSPIWIYFHSTTPYYNRIENWGTPEDYK